MPVAPWQTTVNAGPKRCRRRGAGLSRVAVQTWHSLSALIAACCNGFIVGTVRCVARFTDAGKPERSALSYIRDAVATA
jgi:hypothetical protein